MTQTRDGTPAEIGKNATSSIRDMVAALECDYDRLEELREGDCKDRDDAEQRIREDPLSIEFRTRWMDQREIVERDDWAEACILLTTGGPAVRIMVELENGEPSRAYLQTQDWGTPWTDYYEEGIGELLMTYVNVFCWE